MNNPGTFVIFCVQKPHGFAYSDGVKVFLSWSGEPSRKVGIALHDWLPLLLHYIEPWLSDRDISAGGRWVVELGRTLEESVFGILCVTRTNVSSDWLLFEAGALSKSLNEAAVVPYLLGMELSELSGPLSQFQAKKADKASTLEIIQAINLKAKEPLASDRLSRLFDALWPKLELALAGIGVDEGQPEEPARSREQVFEDLVASIKSMNRRLGDFEATMLSRVAELEGKVTPRGVDVARLEGVKELIKHAESLAGEQPTVDQHLQVASVMCRHCLKQIKLLFTTEILSDEAKESAKRLIGRAEAILALCEKQLTLAAG